MSSWAGNVDAITLFVEDLAVSKAFYASVFDLPVAFEDAHSAVFRFGPTMINLLDVAAAPDLVAPQGVGHRDAGARMQLTVFVPSVDGLCETLQARGATLVNGPMDRAWGSRTACFADPDGHLWEIAQPLGRSEGNV